MDRLYLQQITDSLKSSSQYEAYFDADDKANIEKARAFGRRAARDLGWKVRTFASDSTASDNGVVRVIVAVIESSPLHEELMRVRADKAIRRVFAEEVDLPG